MITLEKVAVIVAEQRRDAAYQVMLQAQRVSYVALQEAWKALQDEQLQHALYVEALEKCSIS